MQIDKHTGLLEIVRFEPSPNFNDRPHNEPINLLVIHSIQLPPSAWGSSVIDDLFCNRLDPNRYPFFAEHVELRVSAHLLINRDGKVTQYVPFHKRAWHAGESNFNGKANCNNFSIGIELEAGFDVPYTEVQYRILAQIVQVLLGAYPGIKPERIVGHSEIAPGRKEDPGPLFDWHYLTDLLKMDDV